MNYVQTTTKIVNTASDPLRLHSTKTEGDSNVIAKMPKGASVSVIKETADGWAEVTYNGKTGYCASRYLKDPNMAVMPTTTGSSTTSSTQQQSTLKQSTMTDNVKKILKWTGIAAAVGVAGYFVYKAVGKKRPTTTASAGKSKSVKSLAGVSHKRKKKQKKGKRENILRLN